MVRKKREVVWIKVGWKERFKHILALPFVLYIMLIFGFLALTNSVATVMAEVPERLHKRV